MKNIVRKTDDKRVSLEFFIKKIIFFFFLNGLNFKAKQNTRTNTATRCILKKKFVVCIKIKFKKNKTIYTYFAPWVGHRFFSSPLDRRAVPISYEKRFSAKVSLPKTIRQMCEKYFRIIFVRLI